MAKRSSVTVWSIPWIEELGGLQPTGPREPDASEQLSAAQRRLLPSSLCSTDMSVSVCFVGFCYFRVSMM